MFEVDKDHRDATLFFQRAVSQSEYSCRVVVRSSELSFPPVKRGESQGGVLRVCVSVTTKRSILGQHDENFELISLLQRNQEKTR